MNRFPHTCTKCNQSVFIVADRTQPSRAHYSKGGDLLTMDFPLMPHESGLCYFHLKHHYKMFSAQYPLQNRLGKGEI